MKMIVLFSMLISVHTTWALEGGGGDGAAGNGGGAIVCRDADRRVQKAFLLDLWEAESLPLRASGFAAVHIERESTPYAEQILAVLTRIQQMDPYAYERLRKELNEIEKVVQIKPLQMRRVFDSGDIAAPEEPGLDCAREQLANYSQKYGLVISKSIWEKLSETDRAALFIHEAIYKYKRQWGATDSDESRILVGHVFSGAPLEKKAFGNLAERALRESCQDVTLTVLQESIGAEVEELSLGHELLSPQHRTPLQLKTPHPLRICWSYREGEALDPRWKLEGLLLHAQRRLGALATDPEDPRSPFDPVELRLELRNAEGELLDAQLRNVYFDRYSGYGWLNSGSVVFRVPTDRGVE